VRNKEKRIERIKREKQKDKMGGERELEKDI